jgi:hypothetical protein
MKIGGGSKKKWDENWGWRLVWGWSNHPHAQAGGPTTPKRQKKKKTEKWVLGFWGWSDHPQGAWGWLRPPVWGGCQALRGGLATPKSPIPIFLCFLCFFFFFFFFGLLGLAGPPLDRPWGWLQPPLWLKMGWPPPPPPPKKK